MLTPKQLYDSYSANVCSDNTGYTSDDILRGNGSYANGTPHYMRRVVQFMRHLRFPCIKNAPHFTTLLNTGHNKIALPFKLLQTLDSDCFKESQPTIRSGTSHSIRNTCDISRACMLIANNQTQHWKHRMAPEYLEYFGENSLSDCLMALGPDLVGEDVAYFSRAPNLQSMDCLPTEKDNVGATGASWSCMTPPSEGGVATTPKCRSCKFCEDESDDEDPCCIYSPGTIIYQNECCKAPRSVRADFGYLISTKLDKDNNSLRFNIIPLNYVDNISIFAKRAWDKNSITLTTKQINDAQDILYSLSMGDAVALGDGLIYAYVNLAKGRFETESYEPYTYKLRSVGIIPRAVYGGYANFLDNAGSNFYGIVDDIFIDYFNSINGSESEEDRNPSVHRARTISLLSADTQEAANSIKDLLWNGYGVVLFSNVGFPNSRDSQGISYPDRMWYTTYAIIGYDDTRVEFNECVYVLSCPWGKWISGGNPSWGPLPDGCFLVTETHLKCMLRIYADRDYYNCRSKLPCNPILYDCESSSVLQELAGCGGHGPADKCEPYFCASQQQAMGLAFAISLTEGFTEQILDHTSYLPIRTYQEQFKEQSIYYKY